MSVADGMSQGAGQKDVYEVLRQKEMDLARLRREVEALLVVIPLITDSSEVALGLGTSSEPKGRRNRWPLQVDKTF
jgi:hypothetical protein